VVVKQNDRYEVLFAHEKTNLIIKDSIDLDGKTIKVGDNCKLIFRNGSISNGAIVLGKGCTVNKGVFENVSFSISSNTSFKKCSFDNKNTNICIQTQGKDAVQNIVIKQCNFYNVGNSLRASTSVHCIYLNSVSDVTVKECSFVNIGNLYTQKVSGISINTSNQTTPTELTLVNINVEDNLFSGIISKDNIATREGEYHFIIVSSSENVLIKDNICDNHYESVGFGKEPIYLKCTNSSVENNRIEGVYGGEAIICVKNYTRGNISTTPFVDIIDNDIKGTYFEAIYHTGSGTICGNTIVNTQAYGLSCENNRSVEGHSFVIENNTISLGEIIPSISTGSARAPLTLLSYEGKPIKAIIKNNTIKSKADIETIRCRFAYDTVIELKGNDIEVNRRLLSFGNLDGKERKFIIRTNKNNLTKQTAIEQPPKSSFVTFSASDVR
jgi:hypothetical protein